MICPIHKEIWLYENLSETKGYCRHCHKWYKYKDNTPQEPKLELFKGTPQTEKPLYNPKSTKTDIQPVIIRVSVMDKNKKKYKWDIDIKKVDLLEILENIDKQILKGGTKTTNGNVKRLRKNLRTTKNQNHSRLKRS